MAKPKIYSIYHMMDEKGVFDKNPANTYARDEQGNVLFEGPVKYPKMFYHPTGEEKIIVPGEEIETRRGFVVVGEQRELIWMLAQGPSEEKLLREEGWHEHPADAIAASPAGKAGKVPIPAKGAAHAISVAQESLEAERQKTYDLEQQLVALQTKLKLMDGAASSKRT